MMETMIILLWLMVLSLIQVVFVIGWMINSNTADLKSLGRVVQILQKHLGIDILDYDVQGEIFFKSTAASLNEQVKALLKHLKVEIVETPKHVSIQPIKQSKRKST